MLINTARSLGFEPGADLCEESWIEYINRDYMTDASDPSCRDSGEFDSSYITVTKTRCWMVSHPSFPQYFTNTRPFYIIR